MIKRDAGQYFLCKSTYSVRKEINTINLFNCVTKTGQNQVSETISLNHTLWNQMGQSWRLPGFIVKLIYLSLHTLHTLSVLKLLCHRATIFAMDANQSKGAAEEIELVVTEATSGESLLANWVVDFEARARNTNMLSQEKLWERASIYKVPDYKRELNPRAFTPVLVSFGPFHHDNVELKKMEVHKERALVQFINKTSLSLQNITNEVAKIIDELRDAYHCLDDRWKTNDEEFLKMMILDGSFTLEILQRQEEFNQRSSNKSVYSDLDPYFSLHAAVNKWPYIRRDMLLIENQLPLLLLKTLVLLQTRRFHGEINFYINWLILNLIAANDHRRTSATMGLHALDLFRHNLLGSTPRTRSELRILFESNSPLQTQSTIQDNGLLDGGILFSYIGDDYACNPSRTLQPAHKNALVNLPQTQPELNIPRCAVELDEAGVRFKKSKNNNLKEIEFESGKFHLPYLKVDDTTECSLLNVITFEYLHVKLPPYVTVYVTVMDEIIDSANDVRLLRNKGLILNALGSDEEVAHIFNSMGKEIVLCHNKHVSKVMKNVSDYCKKRRHSWRAYMIRTYFKNPWSIISLAGALLVIALAIAQTVYASFQK